MRIVHSSNSIATMKFLIYSCFIIFTTQFSAFAEPRTSHLPATSYNHIDIRGDHFEIPENSWWNGTRSTKARDSYSWPFAAIKYKKDIPEDSPIRVSWKHMFDGSVFLCNESENLQDDSIIISVRELLGIPEGCPVSAGHVANTSDLDFPLKNRSLYFNSDLSKKSIRILTNIWESDTSSAENLFKGHFYIDDPAFMIINPTVS